MTKIFHQCFPLQPRYQKEISSTQCITTDQDARRQPLGRRKLALRLKSR